MINYVKCVIIFMLFINRSERRVYMLTSKKTKNVERWEQKQFRKFLECKKCHNNKKRPKMKECPHPTHNTSCYLCDLRFKW